MTATKAYVRWSARVGDRSEVFEVLDYRHDGPLGWRVLCVGSGQCPLWFDVAQLEVEAVS